MQKIKSMSVDEELEFILKYAREVLTKTASVTPMAVLVHYDEQRIPILMIWKDQRDKIAIAKKVKAYATRFGLRRFCFMSEIWMRKVKTLEDHDMNKRVSEYPDRVEALLVQVKERYVQRTVTQEFFRNQDGTYTFNEPIYLPSGKDTRDYLWGDVFDEAWFGTPSDIRPQ